MVINLMKCDVVLPGRSHHSALLEKARPSETLLSTKPHGVTPHSIVSSDLQLNVASFQGPIFLRSRVQHQITSLLIPRNKMYFWRSKQAFGQPINSPHFMKPKRNAKLPLIQNINNETETIKKTQHNRNCKSE